MRDRTKQGPGIGSDSFALMALVVISIVTLLMTIICFGLLHSTWNWSTGYSATGAAAFSLTAFVAVGRLYNQLRNDQLQRERRERAVYELKDTVQELQNKLLRGSSPPADFVVEVDDHQHIVLARPKEWVERGGIIWDLQEPRGRTRTDDHFPATFKVSWWPMPAGISAREFYEKFRKDIFDSDHAKLYVGHYTAERVVVGGQREGHPSLKVIGMHYARLNFDPAKCTVDYEFITREEYDSGSPKATDASAGAPPSDASPEATRTTDPQTQQVQRAARSVMGWAEKSCVYTKFWRSMVISCNERLHKVFIFEALDDENHFAEMTEKFNRTLDSVRFLVPSSIDRAATEPDTAVILTGKGGGQRFLDKGSATHRDNGRRGAAPNGESSEGPASAPAAPGSTSRSGPR
jgi:hypothetical protein